MNPLGLPIMVSVALLGMASLCGLVGLGLLLIRKPAATPFLIYTIFPLLSGVAASWIGLVVLVSALPHWDSIIRLGGYKVPFPLALYYATIPCGIACGAFLVYRRDRFL